MSTTTLAHAIAPEIFGSYPGYRRGLVVVRDARNDADGVAVEAALRVEEERLRQRVGGADVATLPAIAAWRDAYRRFGAKPSEHRSSIEAMTRRVARPGGRDGLPSINPLVDIGNLVSLRHGLPAGVHPLPAGDASLALRPAVAGDTFVPADGAPIETPPDGEIVFAHGREILTRRWTWRQAAGTQTLRTTRDVFFNVDGLPPIAGSDVEAAMADIERLVQAHTGGRIALSTILAQAQPSIRIAID